MLGLSDKSFWANWLLITIIAHLLSDFVFQTTKMVELKKDKKIRGFLYHFLTVFLVTFALSALILKDYGDSFRSLIDSELLNSLIYNLIFSFIIAFLHIIVDLIKELIANNSPKRDLYMFFLDQIIHLGLIYTVWNYITGYFTTVPVDTGSYSNYLRIEKLLIIIIVYLLVLFVAAVLLEKVLKLLDVELINEKDSKISRYIGIIERALIVTLVSFGYVSSIGIIFTAKSLARYRELSENRFVEYYLLGTLASLLIALIGGLFINNVIL